MYILFFVENLSFCYKKYLKSHVLMALHKATEYLGGLTRENQQKENRLHNQTILCMNLS